MSSFVSQKSLSDEDIDRSLDLCLNTELRITRESNGVPILRCPACGLEVNAAQVENPRVLVHMRAECAGAWS